MSTSSSAPQPTPNPAIARQAFADELAYRRELRWRIFAWSSAVCLAIIAGAHKLQMGSSAKAVLSVAVLAFACNAAAWAEKETRKNRDLKARLDQIHEDLAIRRLDSLASQDGTSPKDEEAHSPEREKPHGRKSPWWERAAGHARFLLFLGLVAFVAIWLPIDCATK